MSDAITARVISDEPDEAAGSGVSWAAIIAGAVASSAFALALVTLGAGIGLASISPWSANNPSSTTFGALAAAWFIAVELFSCALGGYIAGRLRARWVVFHTDEVFFRDTAHGLLVWALGAVLSAFLITSGASSLFSGVGHAGAAVAQTAGAAAGSVATQATSGAVDFGYFSDMLFRSEHAPSTDTAAQGSEATRIFTHAIMAGELPGNDKTYLAQMIATRTGLSQSDAEKRVADVLEQAKASKQKVEDAAKQAADAARKSGVYVALWAFVSLLVGAFSASYMATIGGRLRDDLPAVGRRTPPTATRDE